MATSVPVESRVVVRPHLHDLLGRPPSIEDDRGDIHVVAELVAGVERRCLGADGVSDVEDAADVERDRVVGAPIDPDVELDVDIPPVNSARRESREDVRGLDRRPPRLERRLHPSYRLGHSPFILAGGEQVDVVCGAVDQSVLDERTGSREHEVRVGDGLEHHAGDTSTDRVAVVAHHSRLTPASSGCRTVHRSTMRWSSRSFGQSSMSSCRFTNSRN